jgi:hypothetical protein
MKIEIVLKDPRYCDDCPCLGHEDICCNLGLHNIDLEIDPIPDKLSKIRFIRPQTCREKYGD